MWPQNHHGPSGGPAGHQGKHVYFDIEKQTIFPGNQQNLKNIINDNATYVVCNWGPMSFSKSYFVVCLLGWPCETRTKHCKTNNWLTMDTTVTVLRIGRGDYGRFLLLLFLRCGMAGLYYNRNGDLIHE